LILVAKRYTLSTIDEIIRYIKEEREEA
jgi:hypothetical protein